MFPASYLPDYVKGRGRSASTIVVSRNAAPSSTNSGVVSVAALPHAPITEQDGHASSTPAGRVDTKFALPPALITCLVCHVDAQHRVLATPAIVEHCLRDLQRRLMPWVAVERVFGSMMRATVPAAAGTTTTTTTSAASLSTTPAAAAAIPGGSLAGLPPTAVPQAGSYLSGSHVRIQLAKTTDSSVVVAIGASVLHLLFYAVDEPESRPSLLAHIVQQWLEALKTKGEEHDCMVLLVHGDLIAASEAAARMAEEVQVSSSTPAPRSSTPTPPPAPPQSAPASATARTQPSSSTTRSGVSQDKVDAAAALLRRYYKELQDLKFSRQQVSAYTPNETPMRILERLRPAVIARGGRLRQALQIAAALKRQCPQDPSTKPVPWLPPALPATTAAGEASAAAAAAATPRPSAAPSPVLSPRGGSGAAHSPSSPPQRQYFNIQSLWRTGYDLVVHYLQYGLVFDARETLEHLYLEYYNNSDDYAFLRSPVATLERLGRVPNLFDAHGHAGWDVGRSGYPKALEPGAELLEGLLLLAAAEMACSLLLGEPAKALQRHRTFVQVTREKFEEWNAAEAAQQASARAAAESGAVASTTYQQFFLLQCYLSGLRMWWPTSGLCRPRRAAPPARVSPPPPPAAVTHAERNAEAEKRNTATKEAQPPQSGKGQGVDQPTAPSTGAASTFSPLRLPPLKVVSPPGTGSLNALPAPEVAGGEEEEEESLAVALHTSPLLLPATGPTGRSGNSGGGGDVSSSALPVSFATAANAAAAASAVTVTDVTSSGQLRSGGRAEGFGVPNTLEDATARSSGVCYSMTNPSFALTGSQLGHSFRGAVGSFVSRSDASSAERKGETGQLDSVGAAPLLVPAAAPSPDQAEGVDRPYTKTSGAVDDHEKGCAGTAALAMAEDDDDTEATALESYELHYLMAGSEDTVQLSVGHLIELAVLTGLVTANVEPEELNCTSEAIREALACGNVALARDLQQRQRQLRRSCADVATLLEHARDSLAAVARNLQYSPFLRLTDPLAQDGVDREHDNHRKSGGDGGEGGGGSNVLLSPTASTTVTATAFANVAELSSPAQALRLWRTLAAMAALALRLGEQRRREFHLYARLAVTFLSDHPSVAASIVADRLLPYVKTQGWRQLELFVRRLYVEAREQRIRNAGLLGDLLESHKDSSVDGRSGSATATVADLELRRTRHARLWPRVFRTGDAYALYRECVLVLISNGSSEGETDAALTPAPTQPALQVQQQQQRDATSSATAATATAAWSSTLTNGLVGVEDAVGALDTRLFATRTRTQWWRELLRIDAIVMPAFFAGEPPEYPLNNFTSPLLVRLEKQRPPSAVNTTTTTASRSTAPFLAANAALPLQANVEEVVRMCFAMACAVNPLAGPDGEQRLRVSSPLSARPARGQAAVRLQLTLESRKDWEDEEEPTHVVHINDCEEASYDEATQQLHVVFAFPVCHAGVYRVRRIRLCNGVTWLAHYPQLSGSSSVARRQASAGVELGQRGSSISSPFQLVTRAPLLRVAEPRSSVHLRLTLPEEAHCFADSVDYATLEVELEDPLYLTVHASPAAGGEAPSPSAPSSRLTRGVTGANREESGVGSAVGVGEAQKADHSNWAEADDEAECSCFYEASPGNLVLPLTVTAAEQRHAHSFPRRSESRLGTSFADDALELSSQQQQQRLSAVSPGYRALVGNDSLSVGNDSLVLSAAEGRSSRGGGGGGGSLIAAVLIGTPSVYRPKTASAVTAAAASAAARGHPGASLSHVIAPRSPDGVAVAANSASFMNRSGSFAHRRLSSHSHHNQQQQQHSQLSARHRSAAPLSPADMQLSSSARAASHPVHTLPSPAAQPLAKLADESRYKAVFKTLRIATASAAAAGEAPPTLAPTPRGDSARSLGSSHHQHHQQQQLQQHRDHLPAHSLRHHGHTRSPATSERSYHDGPGSADPDGSRRAGMSFSGGAFPPGAAAASGAAWHASPLHEVDAETFELVLAHHHVSAGASGGSTTASPASAKKPTTPVGAAAAGGGGGASAVARTSIPIHLRSFLRCLPAPEVQAQPLHALSAAEAKAAEALLAATPGPLLQAESAVLADPMRESVIRLRAASGLAQSLAAGTPTGLGNHSGSACSGGREGPLAAASADGAVADDGTATVVTIPLTRLRLKVPLLPLLVTPDNRAPGTAAESAEKTAASGGSTINGSSNNTRDSGASGGVCADSASAPTSSAEAARQARFTFTCMRGREPSTTSLSVAVPFQLAVSFDYAFKHFQGRVYCLVRMRNLLKKTSLWMRGAVLRVLDAEPSYEMVRVCDVYNDLLMSEWKPQEELSILYELDLIASFHPVQPECAHQVQMQVFYSSWEHCYQTTPAEDRLVLRTVQLPPTEATAESVELVDGDPMSAPSPALNGAAAAAATVQGASSGQDSDDGNFFFHVKGEEEEAAVASPPLSPSPHHPRVPTNLFSGSSASSPANSRAHNSLGARGGLGVSVTGTSMQSDHSVGSITRSVTHVAHSASRNGDDDDSSSSSDNNSMFLSGGERGEQTAAGGALRLSSAESSTAASGAVHFNVVTLRHLEEHCNSVCGPVATFHSKHLCVFSIVMYAESPWTMRFGAATNYVARAPATPLSGTMNGSAGSAPLPRASLLAGAHSHHSSSTFSATQSSGPSFGGPSGGGGGAATADSFFGNAMVDQPSDFVFVAGEPVRFCVRLQPQAQNWPEDANMEETFFIRLKYNPAEWMVIGKQRDRRTLSLMEEVTVYFNAVPLLPLANGGEDAEEEGQGSAGTARAGGRQRSTARHHNGNDEDEEGNSSFGSDGGTGGQDTNARQDAVSAGRSGEGDCAGKAARSSSSSSSSQLLAGDAVRDEGILQTPTVEMFWERRKAAGEVEGGVAAAPSAAKTPTGRDGSGAGVRDSSPQAAHEDAVMGEAVLIDVVQFRTWVRVRKHGHS